MIQDTSITPIKFAEEDLNGSIPDRFLKVIKGLPDRHIAYKDETGDHNLSGTF